MASGGSGALKIYVSEGWKRPDNGDLRALIKLLEKRKHFTFRNLTPVGHTFVDRSLPGIVRQQMSERIARCDVAVFPTRPHVNKDERVDFELFACSHEGLPLIGVLVPGVKELPKALARRGDVLPVRFRRDVLIETIRACATESRARRADPDWRRSLFPFAEDEEDALTEALGDAPDTPAPRRPLTFWERLFLDVDDRRDD